MEWESDEIGGRGPGEFCGDWEDGGQERERRIRANEFLGVHVAADQQWVDSIREKALSTSNESLNWGLEAFKSASLIPVVIAEMSF